MEALPVEVFVYRIAPLLSARDLASLQLTSRSCRFAVSGCRAYRPAWARRPIHATLGAQNEAALFFALNHRLVDDLVPSAPGTSREATHTAEKLCFRLCSEVYSHEGFQKLVNEHQLLRVLQWLMKRGLCARNPCGALVLNRDGETISRTHLPLLVATISGHTDVMRFFLDHGADLFTPNAAPLVAAAVAKKQHEALKILLGKQERAGRDLPGLGSAIFRAYIEQDRVATKLLMAAKPGWLGTHSKSIATRALEMGLVDVLRELKRYGGRMWPGAMDVAVDAGQRDAMLFAAYELGAHPTLAQIIVCVTNEAVRQAGLLGAEDGN